MRLSLDKCEASLHTEKVIQRFTHRGLQQLFEQGDEHRLPRAQIRKLKRILHQLDLAKTSKDMDIPGWRLHKLKGKLKEYWAVWVTKNVRLWFRFEDGHAWDVDYGDYH
jgi:proteic killer suppression protein